MPKEVCVCAAIKTEHWLFLGWRHHNCHRSRVEIQDLSKYTQGFYTSLGRFVDRTEAYHLQTSAGIPSADPSGYRTGLEELFSEDLY